MQHYKTIKKLPDGSPVHSDVYWGVPTPIEVVCDRILLDTLLDFFDSPHLAERAAQLAFFSEMLLLRQPRRLQLALDIRAPRLVIPFDLRKDGPVVAVDMGHLTFMRGGTGAASRGVDLGWGVGADENGDGGANDADEGFVRHGSLDDLDDILGAAPSASLDGVPSPPRFPSASSSLQQVTDFLYDTYEVS